MTTLTPIGTPASQTDASLGQDITLQHPDIWGRTQGTSTLKIKPGVSWAQWQLTSYFKKNGFAETLIQQAIYGEWLPGGLPEGYLDVLRTISYGSPSQLNVAEDANLAELLLFPKDDQERADARIITQAVLTLRHPFAPGVPRRGEVAYKELISSVAEVLARHVKPAYRSHARGAALCLLDLTYREKELTQGIGRVRNIMFFCLVRRLGDALKHGKKAGSELGFLREISKGEIASLRSLQSQLAQVVSEKDVKSTPAHPLVELVGFMTPERLLSLASLVEEFNMEWALAAMEWGTPVGAESREKKNP